MAIQDKLYTTGEFWEIAHQPGNKDRRLELINGVIVEVAPSSKQNTILAAWIIHLLVAFVMPRGLGYVTGPDGGYELGPNTTLQPDAAYISKARAGGVTGNSFAVAPDLAVEVISPSETSRSLMKKAQLYLRAGGKCVWAIDPDDKEVDVYRLADNGELRVQTLGLGETLDGGEALPGFTVSVQELFAVLEA